MKRLLFLLIPGFALAQNTDQNFVKTTIYKDSTQSNKNIQVTYFDGLGRPIQKVDNAQSNEGKDIVTHIEYDVFGRQVKDYLPYPSSQNTMQYVDSTSVTGGTISYYQGLHSDSNPFSEKLLEASPLDKVLKQASPGNSWAMGTGHEIKFDYQTNEEDEVKLYDVNTTWNSSKFLYDIGISNSTTYHQGELYKTITKDENWVSGNVNTTEEFKDKDGKVVLKRTYGINNKGVEEVFDTYYVYDKYGNLTYVIPPLADGAYDDDTLNGLCYQYKYDYRNRLAAKKLPGKQWEYIVYDRLDRPVITGPTYSPYGTGESGFMVTEYDALGRQIKTGWINQLMNETERAIWQIKINGGPFQLNDNDVLTRNFYDNYTFAGAPVVGGSYTATVQGLQTGSWVRILDPNNQNISELSYTLYDYKYRPVVNQTNNYLGGYTRVETTLDWAGKTLQTLTKHKRVNADTELVVKDVFQYTVQDRLELHKQQINNQPEQLITKNSYDELGQLVSKNVGGNDSSGSIGLQKVDYNYNIRGWLTDINNVDNSNPGSSANLTDLFSFKIGYNVHSDIGSNDSESSLLYNGNISETYWRTNSDNVIRKYNYKYDALNRMLDAIYIKPEVSSAYNSYREMLSYDKNGNITHLSRNGDLDSDGSIPENTIDELDYSYDPIKKNQLMKVVDYTNNPQGFKDDTDGVNDISDDYKYDDNGNMIKDENKGIDEIYYNHLNLPVYIKFRGIGQSISYLYSATGKKVKKTVNHGAPIYQINNTDYLDGFQYKDNTLQFFPHAEGYVNNTVVNGVSNFNYVFNYTDHLGNIRLSYGIDPETQVLKIIEENHYYPFGLKHTNYNSVRLIFKEEIDSGIVSLKGDSPQVLKPTYNYKFNGKELQDELGLNMYDFGARNYDAAIGRWINMDPLSEMSFNLTPYRYSGNNPVIFKDPDGLWEFKTSAGENNRTSISLNKSNDDDNLDSFKKESGLSDREIRKQLFGGDKKAMEAFFGGDKSSINVSEFSGKLGTMLQGMETALNEGNAELAKNPSDDLIDAQNNCWNSTINLTTDGNVNSVPFNGIQAVGSFFDTALNNYSNVSTPQTGDAIRYSNDGGKTTTHGSVFLLQNDNGVQMFTKNGYSNNQPFQIMYAKDIPPAYKYGEMVGKTNYQKEVRVENSLTKQSTTEMRTVTDSSPFYRK